MRDRLETRGLRLAQCRARARRGVLLLVVLSLLVLFALIGITFVLVAGRYLDTTRRAIKSEQSGTNPREICDEAFAQLIRGTTNPHSAVYQHDLLSDLYGNDGAKGQVSMVEPVPNVGTAVTQLIDLTVPATSVQSLFTYLDSMNMTQPIVATARMQAPGFYNGCVLTMTSGPFAGRSTRIVGWGYDGTANFIVRVMAFDGLATLADLSSHTFIVNGRPFNGTGFGFNVRASVRTDPTLLSAANLMLCSRAAHPPFTRYCPTRSTTRIPTLPTVDSAAWAVPTKTTTRPTLRIWRWRICRSSLPTRFPPRRSRTQPPPIIPSFHRPDLINYYLQSEIGTTGLTDWKNSTV